jgi:outer membrane protein assembly factor BamB
MALSLSAACKRVDTAPPAPTLHAVVPVSMPRPPPPPAATLRPIWQSDNIFKPALTADHSAFLGWFDTNPSGPPHPTLVRVAVADGVRTLGPALPADADPEGDFVLTDGVVAVSTDSARDTLYGIDPTTGRTRFAISSYSYFSPPLADSSSLYLIAGRSAGLMAVNPADGNLRWRAPLTSAFGTQVEAVQSGVVMMSFIAPHPKGGVVGLDARTGATMWTLAAGGTGVVMTAVDPMGLVVASSDSVRVVDVESGRVLSTCPAPERDLDQVLAGNGVAYVAGGDPKTVYAIDLATGRLLWTQAFDLALLDGDVLLGARGLSTGNVLPDGNPVGPVAVDRRTGQVVWTWSGHLWPCALGDGQRVDFVACNWEGNVDSVVAFAPAPTAPAVEHAVIEGTITQPDHTPLAGIAMNVGGTAATTDAAGHYRAEVNLRGEVVINSYDPTPPTGCSTWVASGDVPLTGAGHYTADLAAALEYNCH